MAITIYNVDISELTEESKLVKKTSQPGTLIILDEQNNLLLRIKEFDISCDAVLLEFKIFKSTESARYGKQAYLISKGETGYVLHFDSIRDLKFFNKIIESFKNDKKSVFSERTEEVSASQYFQFYGYLCQQQNMMQDYVRTSTYQSAILSNLSDFKDKIVLDVGAGSGILSFFAVQAGAEKVYAVEASSMAKHAEKLVKYNNLKDKIIVIPGKIEEINLPEQVDVIISEPMGYMLFNERMLETYLHAKKFLKPNGKMYPTRGDLHFAPFTDSLLHMELMAKSNFWIQQSFHGVDLTVLRSVAIKEYFKQPIIDTFDINICLAKSQSFQVNFLTAHETDLHDIYVPYTFTIHQTQEVNGLAFWFDVGFLGSDKHVWLSTNPTQPLTHWYQIRCLVNKPVFVYKDEEISGHIRLICNKRQSYDVEIEIIGPRNQKSSNTLDLKNPFFHYTGQPVQPAVGSFEQSPSENLWVTIDQQQQQSQIQVSQDQTQDINQQNLFNNNFSNSVIANLTNGNIDGNLNSPVINTNQSNQQIVYQSQTPVISLNNNIHSPNSTNKTIKNYTASTNNNISPSIVGGIVPSIFNPVINSSSFLVSNNLMIGDYVTPGNIILPGQNQQNFK